jgi:phage terminase large subunit GpA-like protein
MTTDTEQLESVVDAYTRGQTPPPPLDLDDWADRFRYINEVSGEKWRTSRVEVARGPMKAVTEPGVRTITVVCSTQLMKTELILNTIGYFMHIDPCPVLSVLPTEGIARKFSDVRLKKMLKATPVLQDKVAEGGKTSANTVGFKEFPGGFISIVGSHAPAALAMLPCRLVTLDEIDKFIESAGDEGDPITLAEERQATFSTNSLAVRACSPTIAGQSRIMNEYESSDMRKPFVACPHCHGWQVMKWPNVIWDKDKNDVSDPETVNYKCEHCGTLWNEPDRHKALKNIQWRQTAKFNCRHCDHTNEPDKWHPNDDASKWRFKDNVYRAYCESCGVGKCDNRHAGFWASKLYSPFRPLSELVAKWLGSQGNIEKLKAFINTQLAEVWEESGDHLSNIDGLIGRREKYEADLPGEVGVIVCGVDVQGAAGAKSGRFEGVVKGYGPDEECWILRRFIIPGDLTQGEVWNKLEQELERPYVRADGRVSYIAAACIDLGGGHTHSVAMFCRDKIERRFWPIRGVASVGRAIPIWPKKPGRTDRIQIPFYNIGVDNAKNVIFSRLLNNRPGPAFYHFPINPELNIDQDFFEQLTAEKRVLKYRGTQRYYVWENPQRKRNEAWDCCVYAYAALCGLMAEGLELNAVCENGFFIMEGPRDEPRPPTSPQSDGNAPPSRVHGRPSRPSRKVKSRSMRR